MALEFLTRLLVFTIPQYVEGLAIERRSVSTETCNVCIQYRPL